MGKDKKRKGRAIIVGGSIAGVSSAISLISSGNWEVVVVDKSYSPTKTNTTGAGLALDPLSIRTISSWLLLPLSRLLLDSTLPLSIDQNQAIDKETKTVRILTRDENFNFRAAHWGDLHRLLCSALPPEVFLWGHVYQSFHVLESETSKVNVCVKNLRNGEVVEIVGDLLVAADGCLSTVRRTFLADLKLRYSGYCAWRGVFDFSGKENSDAVLGIRRAYPEIGNCLYFDVSVGTHIVLYELANKKINWIWYVNQPEPDLKGTSVTMKVNREMIEEMQREAEKFWLPEFVNLIKETPEPFLNFIYDHDPLDQITWDNVVLVGDAAHPTTPHGVRSTNMAILDAAVLGKCIDKWGLDKVRLALQEYQEIRLPVTSKQVLHSRRMGLIKQGVIFDPMRARTEDCGDMQQKSMPFFSIRPGSTNNKTEGKQRRNKNGRRRTTQYTRPSIANATMTTAMTTSDGVVSTDTPNTALNQMNQRIASVSSELEILRDRIGENDDVQKLVRVLKSLKAFEKRESDLRCDYEAKESQLEAEAVALEERLESGLDGESLCEDLDCKVRDALEKLNSAKKELGVKLRAHVSLKRRIDDVATESEVVQYECRLAELNTHIQEKHSQTHKYYGTYNALLEIKELMLKEISLLNSISSQFQNAITSTEGRVKLINSMEGIVKSTQLKLQKVEVGLEEKQKVCYALKKHDGAAIAEQRRYYSLLKAFQEQCAKNEKLKSQVSV